MYALFEMPEGLEKLKGIIENFPPESVHWNEAENRFQFVDRLLTECLGWERPDIRVELSDESGGRADYVLGHPAKAVLEAKREAKLWDTIPTGTTSKVRKLQPLLQASSNFREAVHQVIPYCTFSGASIAVVCNGPQLAIFQALTPGEEPLKGECYFFDGFSSYVADFHLLWTLLSPEGITENRALRNLSRYRNPRIPAKASQAIPEPNKVRYRSPLQEELRELGSFLLEEIEDNPELRSDFYRECYVSMEANNRHLLLSKQIISSRYSRVSTDSTAPSALSAIKGTGNLAENVFLGAGSKPIVVIGDVGVGKTSFFENLYLSLDEGSKHETLFLTIDLGTKANLADGIKTYVRNSIPEILREKYQIDIEEASFIKSIYHDEIARFDKTIEGEQKSSNPAAYERAKIEFLKEKVNRRDSHIHQAFAHLSRGRKRRIVLIIDNADQRTFDDQQEAFLIAQEFAATRSLFVFAALRPSTFYLSKTTGALSAYQNKILTISPPPADEVIQKRLTFALRVAEGKVAPASLDSIRLNLSSIVSYLRATLRSIRSSDKIRQFLSNITGGNTKAVIELITGFCGSPNVDARKIINIESETGNYTVPVHEFTKHALLGDYAYYNPHSSLVACNVFDVSTADYREHFIAALVVGYLSSNVGIKDKDGFVSGEAIRHEMSSHGFIEDQVEATLKKLAQKRMIETPHSHYRELAVADSESPLSFYYRATSIGVYHVRFWMGSFSFLDATSTDTPIFDENARDLVARHAASLEIQDRFAKTVAFRDYLEARWHLACFQTTYFDLPTVLSGQSEEFTTIERVVLRQKTAARREAGSFRRPGNSNR